MLTSLCLSEDISMADRIRRYEVDRDERLEDLYELYPRLRGTMPADLVESVITDVCLYFIDERSLPTAQLAVCDIGSRKIKFNSRMIEFVDSKKVNLLALRRCTMAHELGHVRLHQDEMEQRTYISFQGNGRFQDSRAYQKESEAELYATVFLVPRELLESNALFQDLVEARRNDKELRSGQLWYKVYRLCDVFGVTPTMMCRSLEIYRWIVKEPAKRYGLHNLRFVGQSQARRRPTPYR